MFKWLKKTGGTPYLRKGDRPNVRIQDGDKFYLYCERCEQNLSTAERLVQQKYFVPATKHDDLPKRYGPWLSKYAASLALRTLHSQRMRNVNDTYSKDAIIAATNAEELLSKFILGTAPNPRQFKQYFYNAGFYNSYDYPDLPKNWNTYIQRSVEYDFIFTDDESLFATFVKTGPLIFICPLKDTQGVFKKDFVRCNEGQLPENQFKISHALLHLLVDRSRNALSIQNKISEAQREISEKEVLKRKDDFVGSPLYKTLQDDLEQFGPKK